MHLSSVALRDRDLYVPGLTREYVADRFGVPVDDVAKLGSAENPLGPSPLAREAISKASGLIDIYPDWTAGRLRRKLATTYGVDAECVVCGAGETEIISWIIRAFASAGDRVLMYEPCFPLYFLTAEAEGRVPAYVPMGSTFEFVVDDYIAALRDDSVRVAFVTNPHSPTGKLMTEPELRRICEASQGKLLVIDEAYIHFTETPGSMHLAQEFDNVLVLRTFSKVFGLAGLRVGFALGHAELIRPLLAIKPTWNMGQLQIAGATAALDDSAHIERTVAMICNMRDYVVERMRGLNRFRVIEGSRSNFFMVEILEPELNSTSVFERLLEYGVIVKDCSVSFRGLGKRYLRVDVSLRLHMDRFVAALEALDGA